MTAEIVIMNKEAVALAADSAVSLVTGPADSPQKVFTSASKIFGLPGGHTVSLMIYNNASFLGIPWEPLLDRFQESIGDAPLPTLGEYADRLIRFLATEEELITPEIERDYFTSQIYGYYLAFRFLFQRGASELMRRQGEISEDQIGVFVAEKIAEMYGILAGAEFIPGADDAKAKELLAAYGPVTLKAIGEVFEELPVPDAARARLAEMPVLSFVKAGDPRDPASQNFSGVVITGFGRAEIFPAIVTYAVEGRLAGLLKFRKIEDRKISLENGGYVIPFAQREMVDVFMAGMDPRLYDALVESLAAVFQEFPRSIIDGIESLGEEEKANLKNQIQPRSDDLVDQISAFLNNYRNSNVIPIINVVISLPRTELAAMAESLVNLTSLKRKVSLQAETVGGPVDVAVISKRDGFVWIKKKQYFRAELNPLRNTLY
ncbi:MAG TPA: hypothetical protein VLY83_06485 [Methanoregula sp.]|nr:hypothetical protein [Methanoregula sp.]